MNTTRQFLGDPKGWKDILIHLSSMQGLWGGWLITISGSLDVVIQRVSPSTREARYKFVLSGEEFTALVKTCIDHDLLAVAKPERPGHPDETMLQVTLVNPSMETRTFTKWAGDSHPAFDPVYKQIFALSNRIHDMLPFYTGPFDWPASRFG
jgi:hypothetical protein